MNGGSVVVATVAPMRQHHWVLLLAVTVSLTFCPATGSTGWILRVIVNPSDSVVHTPVPLDGAGTVVVVTLGTPAAGVAAFGVRARGRGSRVVTVMPPDVEPVVVEVAAVRAVVEVIEATAMPSGSCPGAAPV
jgi:hypothetical protein